MFESMPIKWFIDCWINRIPELRSINSYLKPSNIRASMRNVQFTRITSEMTMNEGEGIRAKITREYITIDLLKVKVLVWLQISLNYVLIYVCALKISFRTLTRFNRFKKKLYIKKGVHFMIFGRQSAE